MTTTTEQQQVVVNINDQLVELDNLITGLKYLYEEIKTSKPDVANLENIVEQYMTDDTYTKRIIPYFKRYQLPEITKQAIDQIKESLDADLENYILAKLDERIERVLRNRI